MAGPPPIDSVTARRLDWCVAALRRTSREADVLASRVGTVLGGTATGADRRLAAELRRLATSTYDAAAAIELATTR